MLHCYVFAVAVFRGITRLYKISSFHCSPVMGSKHNPSSIWLYPFKLYFFGWHPSPPHQTSPGRLQRQPPLLSPRGGQGASRMYLHPALQMEPKPMHLIWHPALQMKPKPEHLIWHLQMSMLQIGLSMCR